MTRVNDFGNYLAKLREKSGYKSQRQLAIEAGISPATLSRIESGIQKPYPDTLKTLSKHLKDVTYEELMEKAGYIEVDPDEDKGKDTYQDMTLKEFLEQPGVPYDETRYIPEEKLKPLRELLETVLTERIPQREEEQKKKYK